MTIPHPRTRCSVWLCLGANVLFPSYTVASSRAALASSGLHRALGTGTCVADGPLAQAGLVYHSGLNRLLCTTTCTYDKWGLANYVLLSRNRVSAGNSPVSAHYL